MRFGFQRLTCGKAPAISRKAVLVRYRRRRDTKRIWVRNP